MKYSIRSFVFISTIFCASCADSTSSGANPADSSPDSITNSVPVDSIHQTDTAAHNELRDVTGWKTEDFIVTEKYKADQEVKRTIEWEREEWKNVKSPLIATYKGCDMGDYFHLNFEDSTGKTYDFGFGNNQFGEYTLYDPELTDNPGYIGKKFVIYWSWEISSFPCCDGEYEQVEAYLPSITKLELRESKANN